MAGTLMLKVAVRKSRAEFHLNAQFEIETPGVVALFGRSGCGKSTLINIVVGLLAPDAGVIELDGVPLLDTRHGHHVPAEHRRIGYVFQDARLFPHLDVRNNLLYGQKRAHERRIAFDDIVTLLGLGGLLARRTHQLSGGERQRVALGRALLSQPRLLLMDEPLASLDLARREEVLPYLEQLRDALALPMIYVSHQFEEVVRLASRVVLLEQGQVVAAGGLSEISLHPQLRSIVGAEAMGAVIEGEVVGRAAQSGLAQVKIGGNVLQIQSAAAAGTRLRVQLLARDLILAVQEPRGLSVRNVLTGRILSMSADDAHSDLVQIDIGGPSLIARVTRAASMELGLRPDLKIWILVKTVSISGHVFTAAHSS
jgi:molybdate transport system ATP-binding protein